MLAEAAPLAQLVRRAAAGRRVCRAAPGGPAAATTGIFPRIQSIVGLVSAGMGLALVPQSVSNRMHPGVEYPALAEPAPLVETGLAWRRNSTSPLPRGFLELLRKN
jgi:DNA-binding transcriptional LysR family regulator